MSSANIVQKLWNYCNVLRDDGMSYGDYVEQLTYLLFLKMADERTKLYSNLKGEQASEIVPEHYNWSSLIKNDGDELFDHYRHILENLEKGKGLLDFQGKGYN
jgi:type I restriction enzyme M protein